MEISIARRFRCIHDLLACFASVVPLDPAEEEGGDSWRLHLPSLCRNGAFVRNEALVADRREMPQPEEAARPLRSNAATSRTHRTYAQRPAHSGDAAGAAVALSKEARTHAVWFEWWQTHLSIPDFQEFAAEQQCDFLPATLRQLPAPVAPESSDEDEDAEALALLAAKSQEVLAKKTRFVRGQWNVHSVQLGGLGGEAADVAVADVAQARQASSSQLEIQAAQEEAQEVRHAEFDHLTARLERVWATLRLPAKDRIGQAIKYSGSHYRAAAGDLSRPSRQRNTPPSAASNQSDVRAPTSAGRLLAASARPRPASQTAAAEPTPAAVPGLALVTDRLTLFPALRLAVAAWEAAATAIEAREIVLAKLERFERQASDPTRFFRRETRQLQESAERQTLLKELKARDREAEAAMAAVELHLDEAVTFAGRPYRCRNSCCRRHSPLAPHLTRVFAALQGEDEERQKGDALLATRRAATQRHGATNSNLAGRR
jgi:hypothetical protein